MYNLTDFESVYTYYEQYSKRFSFINKFIIKERVRFPWICCICVHCTDKFAMSLEAYNRHKSPHAHYRSGTYVEKKTKTQTQFA